MALTDSRDLVKPVGTGVSTADDLRAALQAESDILETFLGILEERINIEPSPAVQEWLGTWKANLTADRQVAAGYLGDLDAGGGNTDTADAERAMLAGLLSVALAYQKVSEGANNSRLDEVIQAWIADLQDGTDALDTITRILGQDAALGVA